MPMLVFHFGDLSDLIRKREEIGASTMGGEAGGGGARLGKREEESLAQKSRRPCCRRRFSRTATRPLRLTTPVGSR